MCFHFLLRVYVFICDGTLSHFLPPVMSFQKSMKMKMEMYHWIDVKKKTNKNKIYYPNVRILLEWGVKMRQKKHTETHSLSVAHILRFNHFGASTLFVICYETIEHKTTGSQKTAKHPRYVSRVIAFLYFHVLYDYVCKNINEMHSWHERKYAESICICTYASMSPLGKACHKPI